MEIGKTLKARINEISKRKDVRTLDKELGKKAGKKALKDAADDLPTDLLQVIGAINGAFFRWEAIESDGIYGGLRLPNVTRRFQPSGGDIDFGNDDLLWLSLDDSGVYLLRDKNESIDSAKVVYAAPAEEADYAVIANNFADYIQAAMEHGFAAYFWMPDSAADDVREFLSQPAKAPNPVRPGVRVRITRERRGVVGEVVTLDKAPDHFMLRDYLTWVRVDTDDGRLFWAPREKAKPVKNDPYEKAFADPATYYASLLEKPAEEALEGVVPFLSGYRMSRDLVRGPVRSIGIDRGGMVMSTTLDSLEPADAIAILVELLRRVATLDEGWRDATWKKADEYDGESYSRKDSWRPSGVAETFAAAFFMVAYRAKKGFDELLTDHDGAIELLEKLADQSYRELIEPFRKEMRGTLMPIDKFSEWVDHAKKLGFDPPGDGATST